ncbi:hypothetical protein [Halosimplex halobium]|uniref:hypothetical protein n=1 Tax=Halosimplex halobium TaxID=3396618 RepID=UPI003F54E877
MPGMEKLQKGEFNPDFRDVIEEVIFTHSTRLTAYYKIAVLPGIFLMIGWVLIFLQSVGFPLQYSNDLITKVLTIGYGFSILIHGYYLLLLLALVYNSLRNLLDFSSEDREDEWYSFEVPDYDGVTDSGDELEYEYKLTVNRMDLLDTSRYLLGTIIVLLWVVVNLIEGHFNFGELFISKVVDIISEENSQKILKSVIGLVSVGLLNLFNSVNKQQLISLIILTPLFFSAIEMIGSVRRIIKRNKIREYRGENNRLSEPFGYSFIFFLILCYKLAFGNTIEEKRYILKMTVATCLVLFGNLLFLLALGVAILN